ncbi:hypothetical protein BT93_C2594 [Corymbia citriodora subsp. variegata]|nr:hypothetical protein BT93_C2594 [Corymbia citriodora subsp. variegata]
MGDNGFSLSFSSLFVVLLLASKASPSPHPSNVSTSAAAASLAGSRLIADDLGLEYLIDSPHRDRGHSQPEQCSRMRENLSGQTLRTMHSRTERQTPQLRCIQPGLLMKIQASCAFRRSQDRRCHDHFSSLDKSTGAM